MNQQIQPEKPAVKKQTLLVNLSLMAYLCLLIGFLQCFSPHSIPYGLYTSVVVTRESASNTTIYHSSELPEGMYVTHSSSMDSNDILTGITINTSDFATIGSITQNPEDPENPEESGNVSIKFYSSTKDPSADSTEMEDSIIGQFAVVGSSSQASDGSGGDFIKYYYTGVGDHVIDATEVPVDRYVYSFSSSGDVFGFANNDNQINFTVKIDQMNSNQNFIQIVPSVSDMSFVSTPYTMGSYTPVSHLLRGVNTLMALLGGLLPCFLLLLYVWKFHDHPRAKHFTLIACGMIALCHVYSILNIVVTFLRGWGSLDSLLNLILPVAMAVCYIMIGLSSRNGNVSKKWWVITAIVSAVYGLQICLSYKYFMQGASLSISIPYALTVAGHILFLAGLLLYIFFNRLPKKDDTDEEPKEPIIESKNMAPPPQPAK